MEMFLEAHLRLIGRTDTSSETWDASPLGGRLGEDGPARSG